MSDTVMDVIRAFLEREGWAYDLVDDGRAARMRFQGTSGQWTVHIQLVGDEGRRMVCYSLPAMSVPDGRRLAGADLINRLNWGTILGNFEMDMDTGRVRYKTSADFRGGDAAIDEVSSLVFFNVLMMDRYVPAIDAVAWGGQDPAMALAQVEARRLADQERAAATAVEPEEADEGEVEQASHATPDEDLPYEPPG